MMRIAGFFALKFPRSAKEKQIIRSHLLSRKAPAVYLVGVGTSFRDYGLCERRNQPKETRRRAR